MRVIAVDYGEKRIGLAVSDPLEITANPLSIVERKGDPENALEATARVVEEEGAEEVVVGLPLNIDGSHGPAAEAAEAFASALAARVSVPVRTFDERLTTAEAEELLAAKGVARGRRRRMVDAFAAMVLLESYLRSRPAG